MYDVIVDHIKTFGKDYRDGKLNSENIKWVSSQTHVKIPFKIDTILYNNKRYHVPNKIYEYICKKIKPNDLMNESEKFANVLLKGNVNTKTTNVNEKTTTTTKIH